MASTRLMVAFSGTELPEEAARTIATREVAGVTLFRAHNVRTAAQVRALTGEIQSAATAATRPLLVASDQEGGQLIALGDDTTQFAGAMAVGATGDDELAERVGRAIGRELRALGVNVNYAPVCDLANNRGNPSLGIRSFGDDPQAVAGLAAATVRGLQAEGVAATLKHFPGHGDIAVDTHLELAVVNEARDEFYARELVPFRAGLAAGARVVMAGHFAIPAITGDARLPASLSGDVMTDLLRDELGFDGLAITDAFDMHALAQDDGQIEDVVRAIRAGQDLLLGTADAALLERLEEGLALAEGRGLIDTQAREASARRLAATREWLGGFGQPGLDLVGCDEHQALAVELAQRSVTLVRNEEGLIPIRLTDDQRIAVIQPTPTDLTPADTSSYVRPLLAEAVRRRHSATDEFVVEQKADASEIGALCQAIKGHDLVVLGTVAANLVGGQAALAQQVLRLGRPTICVALRTPWDLVTYPNAGTYVCSFGILSHTIEALAGTLFGERPFSGRLPVNLGDLHPRGHGVAA